jgi:hypothetical protein
MPLMVNDVPGDVPGEIVGDVQRQIERLRRMASRMADDLNRTMSQEWSCSVDDKYVLTVRNAEREETVLLDRDVAVDNWPQEAWSTEHIEETLEDDAAEMLAEEVSEVLRLWDIEWPVCAEHDQAMGCCSSVWFCNGPPYHDISLVGQLQA